jgi:hypothetical protein
MDKLLIVWATVLRLLPLPLGMTPLGAFGLFAGANLPLQTALFVPLVPLLVGDFVVGFYDWRIMVFVYLGFLAGPLLGRLIIKNSEHVGQIGGAVAVNAGLFYAVSNFGNWLAFYPKTIEGFVANYVAGLPWLGIAFVADLVYAAILFGAYAAIRRYQQNRQSVV